VPLGNQERGRARDERANGEYALARSYPAAGRRCTAVRAFRFLQGSELSL